MMKTNNGASIALATLIVIIVGAFIGVRIYKENLKGKDTKKTTEETVEKEYHRTIRYYDGTYDYTLRQNNTSFKITIDTHCEEDDPNCEVSEIENQEITSKELKEDLAALFDDLYKNNTKSEISVTKNDLTLNQIATLEYIFENYKNADLTCSALPNAYPYSFKEKGYYTEASDNGYLIVVAMGEQPSSGYDIKKNDIKIEGENVTIYTEEYSPSGETVATVMTYPNLVISCNRKPDNISVINIKNNNKYKEIDKTSEEKPVDPGKKTDPEKPTKPEVKDLEYKILNSVDNRQYNKRGYYVNSTSTKTKIIVSAGEKSTGGYSIKVEKVLVSGTETTIYVDETSPKPDSIVTQAFTYPAVQIEYNGKPTKIVVKEIDTGYVYSKKTITKDDEEDNIPAITYTIGKFNENDDTYNQKGYYYLKDNTVVIASGAKGHPGYKIEIINVVVSKKEVSILVKETEPTNDGDEWASMMTYPSISIKFSAKPDKITIKNITTQQQYKQIK